MMKELKDGPRGQEGGARQFERSEFGRAEGRGDKSCRARDGEQKEAHDDGGET